jgi:hypothetical protein
MQRSRGRVGHKSLAFDLSRLITALGVSTAADDLRPRSDAGRVTTGA